MKLILNYLEDNYLKQATELSFRPESLDLGLGLKKKYFNGWKVKFILVLASWAMGPWCCFNFVILLRFLTYKNIRWSCLPNLTHGTSINLNLPEYFSCHCVHVFEGRMCGGQRMLRTPGSTHTHMPVHTPASAISLPSAKLSSLSIFVSKNGQRWVKPKHQYVKNVFYYTQKYLNMLRNNIHYTNLLWESR